MLMCCWQLFYFKLRVTVGAT